ncbi:nucleotidyltransferase domain-containing protein [Actinoplanes derwentensis]|uniref:nucleotidyltransferase domain-containing protein n=1 Tax=Actinoplanes derwentensis TaxID=113562 RepID=UPI000B893C45|nr:nucleotidyltransferase domain-containing protein [Actinoplanes derwentensis]
MIDDLDATSPRGALAIRLREAVLDRWRAEVQAIGLFGSMAHGDDSDSSDVNLLVVTSRPRTGPKPARRMVDGIPVDLRVITAEQGLGEARLLAPLWPLQADAFITTFPLLDLQSWFKDRREAHLTLLTEARPMEFTGQARSSWAVASGAHSRAVRHAQRCDTDAATMMMAEARLYAAMVTGFLTRTYFRNTADAVKHAGVATAGTQELGAILNYQAEELTARGRPVDGRLGALFD